MTELQESRKAVNTSREKKKNQEKPLGPEGPDKFSHPESHSKMIYRAVLFTYILNINRGSIPYNKF